MEIEKKEEIKYQQLTKIEKIILAFYKDNNMNKQHFFLKYYDEHEIIIEDRQGMLYDTYSIKVMDLPETFNEIFLFFKNYTDQNFA